MTDKQIAKGLVCLLQLGEIVNRRRVGPICQMAFSEGGKKFKKHAKDFNRRDKYAAGSFFMVL